jgi:hypothetical protein
MFDLARAISEWRSDVEFALGTGEDVEELEAHLRELIDAEVSLGHLDEAAFTRAITRIGTVADIEREYRSGEFGLLKSARRILTRSKVGFVRAVDLSILAWLAMLIGPFLLFVLLRSLLALRMHWSNVTAHIQTWPMLVSMWAGIAGACIAVIPDAVRYLRAHRAISARGVVAFHTLVLFLLVFEILQRCFCVRGVNIVHPGAITFGLFSASLLLGASTWACYMCRLSGDARRQIVL